MATKKKDTHGNRGKDLEKNISEICNKYIKEKIANIHKIPTDWIVIRGYNPKTKSSNIVTAYPKEKAIIDFMGEYRGRAIAIEAKSTNNTTSFPFSNIKDNQFEFFKNWGGFKFYIIRFTELNTTYLVDADQVDEVRNTIERKSLTIDWFRKFGIVLDEDLDFIKHI